MFEVLRRDLLIYARRRGEWLSILVFFIIMVALYPLAYGPLEAAQIYLVPGMLWIAILLSAVLAQETLFRNDYQLGVFEQLVISSNSLAAALVQKIIAHWLVTALPIVLFTPIVCLSFALPANSIFVLIASLLLGSITLSLVAALGAGLTISLPRGGALLAIIILPLYIPVLVLGTSAGIASLQALPSSGQLALLLALALLAIISVPKALQGLIKVSLT